MVLMCIRSSCPTRFIQYIFHASDAYSEESLSPPFAYSKISIKGHRLNSIVMCYEMHA